MRHTVALRFSRVISVKKTVITSCLLLMIALLPLSGCHDDDHPTSPGHATSPATASPNHLGLPVGSSANGGPNLSRPQTWAECELFDGVVTPASFNPASDHVDELYASDDGFKQGVSLISEAKPGDRDYNGGRWHLNMLKPGVSAGKYANACNVEDLDLSDFESTEEYFECPLLPKRNGPRSLRVPTDFATIQEALDAAVDGDEVVVEPGTYFESSVIPARAITLRSQSGNPGNTILDGSLNGDSVAMVFFDGDPPGTRAIRGFTLTNSDYHAVEIDDLAQAGHNIVENCRFKANGPYTALRAGGASVDILNNEFTDNDGNVLGGAVLVRGAASIRDNLFRNNEAIPFMGTQFTQGGAIYLHEARPEGSFVEILNNAFEDNYCNDYGGAVYVSEMFDVVIANNTFFRNVADICAGGVYVDFNERSVRILNNLFVENTSVYGSTLGIAICVGTVIQGNTIVGSKGGAAIRLFASHEFLVTGNIVAFGASSGIEWAVNEHPSDNSSGTQTCNDVFGNPLGNYVGMDPDPTNISVDPLFCGLPGRNFLLRADSPCLASNNSCNVDIGALPQGCGNTPVKEATGGRIENMLRE